MSAARRRKLAALAKLRRRAAYAPRGSKVVALDALKKFMRSLLREEINRASR